MYFCSVLGDYWLQNWFFVSRGWGKRRKKLSFLSQLQEIYFHELVLFFSLSHPFLYIYCTYSDRCVFSVIQFTEKAAMLHTHMKTTVCSSDTFDVMERNFWDKFQLFTSLNPCCAYLIAIIRLSVAFLLILGLDMLTAADNKTIKR